MNLKERTLHGIKWSFLTRMVGQVVQYGASVVLARILFPADFGLVGMVGVFTGFAGIFIDFGIGSAIVQRTEVEERQLSAAFGATLTVGAVTSLIICAGAPIIADVYHRDELVILTRVSSAGFLLSAIGVVPRAMLMRSMQIKRLMLLDFAVLVASSICSVVLAFLGAGVWTVVVSALVTAAGQSLLPILFGPWKLSFALDFARLRPLLGVSLNLLGFNVINYWSRNVDNLLIGRTLGERALGLYARGYSLMLIPIAQITGVLGSSMLPMLSRVHEDRSRSKNLFLRTLGMIALVGLPIMMSLAAVADPFVRTLYGQKWIDLIPILRVLALVGALQLLTSPSSWLYVSQGRTDLFFRWGLGACTAIIIALAIGAHFGSAYAIAVAYLVINVILVAPALSLAGGIVDATLRDTFRSLVGPAFCAVVMAAAITAVDAFLPAHLASALRLTIELLVGGSVYCLLAFGMKLQSLVELLRHARERFASQTSGDALPANENVAVAAADRT